MSTAKNDNQKGGLKKMLMSIFSPKTCGRRLSCNVNSPVFVSFHHPITEPSSNGRDRKKKHNKPAMVLRNEGTAMVITTSNPYAAFRYSVMEMMVENDICSCSKSEELERLMRCFLAVNSRHHHPIIIQVFCDLEDLCARSHMDL